VNDRDESDHQDVVHMVATCDEHRRAGSDMAMNLKTEPPGVF
jgi:hypothetical protein